MDSSSNLTPGMTTPSTARVCLGPNAPAEMADFVARAGIEVLPPAHRTAPRSMWISSARGPPEWRC